MRKRTVLLVIVLCGCFLVSLAAASSGRNRKNDLFKQVVLFSDVLAIIENNYVEEVPSKDLIYGALKGIFFSLDPHSQFLDADTYNDLKVHTKGKFGGIGIEVTIQDGLLTVITPIEDTPAWKAGIKPLDRIVKIDSEITRDMSLSDAVKKMRGRPGDKITLTVLRESEKKLLEFKITRDVIKIKDIGKPALLEGSIGYVRLVEFRENTIKNLNTSLEDLTRRGANALILDLRNNPGGLLESSVEVAGKFLPKGSLIVYTKGRMNKQDLKFFSSEDYPLVKLPMAVLINEGSASGSEIVAAALQHYKRAIIIGAKSFGKGSVQTLIPLRDGTAVKLTTSRYFTPGNKQIHGQGVIPDIFAGEKKKEKEGLTTINKEDVFEELELRKEAGSSFEGNEFDYRKDEQVMRAVDLLKALKFYQQKQ